MSLITKFWLKIRFLIAKLILTLWGWKSTNTKTNHNKQIIIAAHHTSSWDYPLMIMAAWIYQIPISWVGKKELFRGPLKYMFLKTGGIPVNREKKEGLVEQLAAKIKAETKINLCIPPEASRSKREGWKTGFYYIALKAQIPITCSYIDYATKTLGFGPSFVPTGDIEEDFKTIAEFYKGVYGKHPEKQTPVKPLVQKSKKILDEAA